MDVSVLLSSLGRLGRFLKSSWSLVHIGRLEKLVSDVSDGYQSRTAEGHTREGRQAEKKIKSFSPRLLCNEPLMGSISVFGAV